MIRCPVCEERFEAEADEHGYVFCPHGCGMFPPAWAGQLEQFEAEREKRKEKRDA